MEKLPNPIQDKTQQFIDFGVNLKTFLLKLRHIYNPNPTKKDSADDQTLYKTINELDKALVTIKNKIQKERSATDTDLIDLLTVINDSCHIMNSINPSVWDENNSFAREYKILFYPLDQDIITKIGYLYPVKKQANNLVTFNITKENKIEIIRSYPDYKHIAYEGGGVKGIAYGGANTALTENGVMQNITHVAGSSAGAITAALVALGYSAKSFTNQINKIDFQKLQDVSQPGGWLGNIFGVEVGLLSELYVGAASVNREIHGEVFINSGKALLTKLREVIQFGIERIIKRATANQLELIRKFGIYDAYANNKITFANLADLALICPEENIKQLIVTGAEKVTDNETRMVLFSALHSPHMEIAEALRISASIPTFFQSVKYNNKSYIDGGVEQNLPYSVFASPEFQVNNEEFNIAQTVGFKFVSPENPHSMFRAHQPSTLKASEKIFLPEMVENLTSNRNREAVRLRSDAAPLVIPISNENVKSTEFNLSDYQKKALHTNGYEMTTNFLKQYRINCRMLVSQKKYDTMDQVIETLNVNELKDLIIRLEHDSQMTEIFTKQFIQTDAANIIDPAEFKNKLKHQLEQLLLLQPPELSVEQQLMHKKAKMELQINRLNKLFADDLSEGDLLRAIKNALNDDEQILKSKMLGDISKLSGANIKKLIIADTGGKEVRNDLEWQKAMNKIQDTICDCIKKQLGFNHLFEVRNQIFIIEKQNQKRNLEEIVDRAGGFNVDLLKNKTIIRTVQSLSGYQELQTWADKNHDTERGKLLEQFFKNVESGNIDWYTTLIKCTRGVIQPDGPRLPKSMDDIVNVIRLFHNGKNKNPGEINLGEVLSEIEQDIHEFIFENLFRHSDQNKYQQDVANFSNMLTQLALPPSTTFSQSLQTTHRK